MERQIISSRQNPLIKLVCGLADKKNRRRSGLFRFDGIKLLTEAINAHAELEYVICRVPIVERLESALAQVPEEKIVYVSESVFQKISEEKSPEGVLCVCKSLDTLHVCSEMPPEGRILLLEAVRDPGNLGTIMRSAHALGIDKLILTDDCADIYNPKTIRAAMGAVFKLPTQTVEGRRMPDFINMLRADGRRVYATALCEKSVTINDTDLAKRDCFVIGNEGHGLSAAVIEACDASVIIPMRENAESLNAAGAAVICIWETVNARGVM